MQPSWWFSNQLVTLRPVGDFLAAGGLGDWEIWADGRQRAISRPVGGFEDLAGAGGGCGQLVNLERASHGITGRLAPSRAVGGFGGPVGGLDCR